MFSTASSMSLVALFAVIHRLRNQFVALLLIEFVLSLTAVVDAVGQCTCAKAAKFGPFHKHLHCSDIPQNQGRRCITIRHTSSGIQYLKINKTQRTLGTKIRARVSRDPPFISMDTHQIYYQRFSPLSTIPNPS